MSADDTPDDDSDETVGSDETEQDVRKRLEAEADRAVEQFDTGIVDLMAWILDTETRAKIYVNLRQHPNSTSEEIAEGTGLYPSTVREALAELHDEGKVIRQKRESDGAGNNPYEYATIPPSELVGDVVDDVQEELNTVFNLDRYLGPDADDTADRGSSEPVTINVESESDLGEDDDGVGVATDGVDDEQDDVDETDADEASDGGAGEDDE